jgi:hypothetical protein
MFHRNRRTRGMTRGAVVVAMAGLVTFLGLTLDPAEAEAPRVTTAPTSVAIGQDVVLSVSGIPSGTVRVDFSVGGITSGSTIPSPGGVSALLATRLWDPGTKMVVARMISYSNGVELVATAQGSVQVGDVSQPTDVPTTTSGPTTISGPKTTFADVTTTISNSAGTVSVQPSPVPPGASVTLSVSGLSPADGVVDFAVAGGSFGSAYVSKVGTASLTSQLYAANGVLPIVATWRRYVAGTLISQTFSGSVTVGAGATTTVPVTTVPVTTVPVTTVPVTTVPVTTVPVTTVPVTTVPATTVPSSNVVLTDNQAISFPVVTGMAKVGATLTCSGWYASPGTSQIQWFDGFGRQIAGETSSTYIVRPADLNNAVGCVGTQGGLSTGSIPLVITNRDGQLPTGSVTVQRAPSGDNVNYSCSVQTSATIRGFNFTKTGQLGKGGPVFSYIAPPVVFPYEAGRPLTCSVFLANDFGTVLVATSADTSRLPVTPLMTNRPASGAITVGATLNCIAPTFSPALPLISLDWTLDAQPYNLNVIPTRVGSPLYVTQASDIGKVLRCRARMIVQTPPFFQGLAAEQWIYSDPVTVNR